MTFTAPLTFYNTTCLSTRGEKPSDQFNAIESTLLSSKPTALRSWRGSSDVDGGGIVVGCEDGTLYLFRTSKTGDVAVDSPVVEKRRRRPQSSLQKRSRPSSPHSYPLSPTFNVQARAPVSLGVTTEQVQAPRNYVDFEDEPERLKDILKGRTPRERERASFDSASLVTISPAPSIIAEPASIIKPQEIFAKPISSTANSPPTSPQSPSSPISNRDRSAEATNLLSLQCHIIPTHAGYGNAIRSIEVFEDNLVIALQESGHLGIYSSEDGSCLATTFTPNYCAKGASRDIWTWSSLQVANVDGTSLLLVTAATDSNTTAATPNTEENSTEKSQTIALKLSFGPNNIHFDKLTAWELEGPAKGIGIYKEPDNSSTLFSVNSAGHFLVRRIGIPSSSAEPSPATSPTPDSDSPVHLSIPQTLKAMVSRSSEKVPSTLAPIPQVTLDETLDVGDLISDSTLTGLSTRDVDGKLYGIVWAHREMIIFEYHAYGLRVLSQAPVAFLEDAEWLDDDTYALSYQDRIEVYELRCVDADNDRVHQGLEGRNAPRYGSALIRQISTGGHDASTFSPTTDLILAKINNEGQGQLTAFKVLDTPDSSKSSKDSSTVLWQSSLRPQDISTSVLQTASVPLDLDVIVQGFSDGRLREYSLERLTFRKDNSLASLSSYALKQSEPAIGGSIVGLHCVLNSRTKEKYVIGGADDGSILAWNMPTFELCARWVVFSTPLVKVVEFQDNAGPLHGCVLCIARDGTVAVIAVDGFQFLYLIPGSATPLTRISLGDSNLVLIYGESIARLWDVKTKEFWRSTSVDKAEEMFGQGGWTALDMNGVKPPGLLWGTVAPSFNGNDAAATLDFSLEKFVVGCIALTKTISTSRDEIRNILQALERLRLLLSVMITPGLNSDVDSICSGKLKLQPSSVGVGLSSPDTTTLYPAYRPQEVWSISSNVSAARMLSIVFILRAMSLFEELSEAANTVIAFYTSSLDTCVGSKYAPPSLEWLGKRWFSAAPDLRQSIRVVFDSTLSQASDQDAIKLAEKWQQYVPSMQPPSDRESAIAALALLICGSIATVKFTLLSINALTDISKSLTMYLHDENSSYRVLAIELCSKGFHVWQHYVDTMEILRALFTLSTGVRKDTISVQNVSSQARLAVLNIATHHTPLFMSTLCLDVLNPPSLDHRRSVMQIIAFLIRKRRHILQPNLPRLMEAVVKSLDPNSNANREAVLDTATEIIGFVVKHFPTVDFHMNTQRLAVGTNEGAVVMYDLKTAIRLYVLEGHKKQLTACSFSPDGRRLVTLSLAEQAVLVWKVGSSFSSFFNPGAPPRQGHGGSEPFKTLNFNIGSEADMTVEESLDLVKFEWVADRSVKVKIRDSILTFST